MPMILWEQFGSCRLKSIFSSAHDNFVTKSFTEKYFFTDVIAIFITAGKTVVLLH